MSIFFRFGDPQLLKLVVSQYFAQRIFQRFRSKGNGSFIVSSYCVIQKNLPDGLSEDAQNKEILHLQMLWSAALPCRDGN